VLRLIVGLGNPGPEHAAQRHNVGFWFVDALAAEGGERFTAEAKLSGECARVRLDGHDIRLLKPATFMNRSGRSVQAALNYWKLDPAEALIVHDDLDLAPGVARLKFDGGHGGQNGLRDIMAVLGHGRFHRLRLGIGHPGHRDRVTGWVLGRPDSDHKAAMLRALSDARSVLPLLLAERGNEAMQRLHTATDRGS
jgi:PTH1 family peptidyl-tRNA hydrolase